MEKRRIYDVNGTGKSLPFRVDPSAAVALCRHSGLQVLMAGLGEKTLVRRIDTTL